MEFLVRSDIQLPPDHPDRVDLIAREIRRGRELKRNGTIERIWRVPGRWSAIALYQVESMEELHDALASLPLWPWMSVTVTPLANHLLETAAATDAGELAGRWK